MKSEEYLYHYTSIEALALILKNRTIRFNSLDKMDDLQEKETADIKNIGQFCYISSWTDDSSESIPMWNMYASMNLGVRIKLPKNPFKVYVNTDSELSQAFSEQIDIQIQGDSLETIIPLAEMLSKGFISPQAMDRQLIHKVEYTDDSEKLYPHILANDGDHFMIKIGELGLYKNLHWEFQREWRYILSVFPLNLLKDSIKDFQQIANRMRLGLEKQPFPYYDMTISDETFSDMEITLSPRISSGSRVIVQSLIEKYNPSAKLVESDLVGLI
ncbi:MAG: DUF2971 domain-containing protein [Oscillospiraceae bacterium]|nr:DUF2971 domain-containing protein [Oscillospiraceae bacterium]